MKWIKISDLINDETFLSLAVIIVPIFVSLFKASKDKMFFFFSFSRTNGVMENRKQTNISQKQHLECLEDKLLDWLN